MTRLKVATVIVGVLLASLFSSSTWADPVLSVFPATSTVSTGNAITLDINITGASDLYAFQFDLNFNPSFVSAVSVAEGPLLTSGGSTFFIPGTIDNVGGTVAATADSLETAIPGVTGDGILAVLTLQGVATGTSSIDFANVILLDSNLDSLNFTTLSGGVTVNSTSVPEPSVLVMLIAGIAVSFLLCKKTFQLSEV